MVKSRRIKNSRKFKNTELGSRNELNERHVRLASMGKASITIINRLYNPIDAVNRFLNLALHNIEEDSQNRQFLLESKYGVRRMSVLLKRLIKYAKQMEKVFNEIIEDK